MIRHYGRDHRYSIDERGAFVYESKTYRRGPHVYLQTCNRVEIYSGDGDTPRHIARHLFRVTAGLESRLIGERHIQGQVKRAYTEAILTGTISSGLHRLFQEALRVGKTVRNQTGISTGAVSYSNAVMELLRRELVDLSSPLRVLIVGVNRTTETIAKQLIKAGCEYLTIANRTLERAQCIAGSLNCNVLSLDHLNTGLATYDVVICATSSERPVIFQSMLPHDKPLLIVDLAVPRDVEHSVADMCNVNLFNVSDVESQIDQNLTARKAEIRCAESIISEAAAAFALSTVRKESSVC